MRLCTTVVCLKQASSPVLAGRVCPYEGPCPHQRAAIADIGIALLVEPGPRLGFRGTNECCYSQNVNDGLDLRPTVGPPELRTGCAYGRVHRNQVAKRPIKRRWLKNEMGLEGSQNLYQRLLWGHLNPVLRLNCSLPAAPSEFVAALSQRSYKAPGPFAQPEAVKRARTNTIASIGITIGITRAEMRLAWYWTEFVADTLRLTRRTHDSNTDKMVSRTSVGANGGGAVPGMRKMNSFHTGGHAGPSTISSLISRSTPYFVHMV
eukprot:1341301-Rhodomonas_salina.2